MRTGLIMLIILISVLPSCKANEQLSDDGSLAKIYLENKGYKVISLIKADNIVVQDHLLTDPGYQQIWEVQAFEPETYIGEKIAVAEFTVEKHPLEKIYGTKTTLVTVFLNNGEVNGGWSFPDDQNRSLSGSTYSLNGETMEGVQE